MTILFIDFILILLYYISYLWEVLILIEQSQNILCLKDDINKLIELGNEKTDEYCKLAICIADINDKIEDMISEKNDINNYIIKLKNNKSFIFSIPIGIGVVGTFFISLIISNLDKALFSVSIFAMVGTPVLGMTLACVISTLLLRSKKFNNYLIKNFSFLNNMQQKLYSLINKINIEEQKLEHLKKDKEEIVNYIINNSEILESKKEELRYIEEMYFKNTSTTPISMTSIHNVNKTVMKRTKKIENK